MKSSNKLSFRDRIARANSRGDFAAVFMMLPAVILLVVMSIYPFFWLFRYICYDYNGFNAYLQGQEISCVCWRMKPSGGVYSIPLSMQD